MTTGRQQARQQLDLPFSCSCGSVAGMLVKPGPSAGDHVVCHCTDCQEFAERLHAGDRVLDRNGGTALYQGRCATMQITRGLDRLACFHLTDKPTLRWYAGCCDTPMFNTYRNGRIPYITTLVANCDPASRARLLGPPIGHLYKKEARGDASHLRHLSMATLMRRFFKRMLADVLTGNRKRAVLFDPTTLEPVSSPAPRR